MWLDCKCRGSFDWGETWERSKNNQRKLTDLLGRGKSQWEKCAFREVGRKQLVKKLECPSCGEVHRSWATLLARAGMKATMHRDLQTHIHPPRHAGRHAQEHTHFLSVLWQGQGQLHTYAPLAVNKCELGEWEKWSVSVQVTAEATEGKSSRSCCFQGSRKSGSDGFALSPLFAPSRHVLWLSCSWPLKVRKLSLGPAISTWTDFFVRCCSDTGREPRKQFPCGW